MNASKHQLSRSEDSSDLSYPSDVPDEPSFRNPLFWPLVGISIAAAQDIWQLLRSSRIDLFGVWSILAAAVLLILYIRNSPAAGSFMFYSLLPIYPVYIVVTIAGFYGEPGSTGTYMLLGVVWVVLSYFAWRWKQAYVAYLAITSREAFPSPK